MKRREYRQYCATARALDVVGERWTLLLVRELLTGPKRNKDLLANLPGIGTNLLAARLRKLEADGLVERTTLPPPAGSTVYRLTDLGARLEPAIMALARWGQHLLGDPQDRDEIRPSWVILGMKAVFRAERAVGLRETYEFRIAGDVFWIGVADGAPSAAQGHAHAPDLIVEADLDTFLDVHAGKLSARAAVQSGAARLLQGEVEALARCLYTFGISDAV
jgi:DNA-binding HxlR family transcriptional regulator/putative sterol carrier protein